VLGAGSLDMDISTTSFIGVQWFLWTCAASLVALRYYMRIQMRQWEYWSSDAFLVLGMVVLTSYAFTNTYYKLHQGEPVLNYAWFLKACVRP
jgi:hypothetical protein